MTYITVACKFCVNLSSNFKLDFTGSAAGRREGGVEKWAVYLSPCSFLVAGPRSAIGRAPDS